MANPFQLPSGRGLRQLYFSVEGGGKTHICAGVSRLCPGRYLYIDNEGSADIYPMHTYTKAEPWGVYTLDYTTADKLQAMLNDELARQAAGKGLYDVIVLDGITEHSYQEGQRINRGYVKKHGEEGADSRTLKRFGDLLVEMVNLMQSLVAISNYGVGILVTAMAERGTDPNIPDGLEARPLANGGIRHILGKHFTQTIYVEIVAEKQGTKVTPAHLYHFVKDGPYRVKNRYEEEWLGDNKTFPPTLKNPTTEEIVALVQIAAGRKAQKLEVHDN